MKSVNKKTVVYVTHTTKYGSTTNETYHNATRRMTHDKKITLVNRSTDHTPGTSNLNEEAVF
jgi:hypothetical protein